MNGLNRIKQLAGLITESAHVGEKVAAVKDELMSMVPEASKIGYNFTEAHVKKICDALAKMSGPDGSLPEEAYEYFDGMAEELADIGGSYNMEMQARMDFFSLIPITIMDTWEAVSLGVPYR